MNNQTGLRTAYYGITPKKCNFILNEYPCLTNLPLEYIREMDDFLELYPSGVGYYVKTTLKGKANTNVTQSCGTSTNPGNCSTITGITSLSSNVWYKIKLNVKFNVK